MPHAVVVDGDKPLDQIGSITKVSLALRPPFDIRQQEQHQKKEVKQAIRLQEKIQALKFKSTVLDADLEAQKNIAPFLTNRVLKRIIMTFMNDPNGDFEKWAKNPSVIAMVGVGCCQRDAEERSRHARTHSFARTDMTYALSLCLSVVICRQKDDGFQPNI